MGLVGARTSPRGLFVLSGKGQGRQLSGSAHGRGRRLESRRCTPLPTPSADLRGKAQGKAGWSPESESCPPQGPQARRQPCTLSVGQAALLPRGGGREGVEEQESDKVQGEGATTAPSGPGTVPVYACHLDVIKSSVPLRSQMSWMDSDIGSP